MFEHYLLTDLCQTGRTAPAKCQHVFGGTGDNERAQSRCGGGLGALIPKYLRMWAQMHCGLFFPGFVIFKLDNWTTMLGWVEATKQLIQRDLLYFVEFRRSAAPIWHWWLQSFWFDVLFSVHFMTWSEGNAGWKQDIRETFLCICECPLSRWFSQDGSPTLRISMRPTCCDRCCSTMQRRCSWCQTGQMNAWMISRTRWSKCSVREVIGEWIIQMTISPVSRSYKGI